MSAAERAPPWVLLRGLMRDRRHWGNFVDRMAMAFPNSEIICLDAPGNGSRHREPSPHRVEAMADDLRAQLQARAIKGPYRVLALSLGAMIATAWATRYPQELQRMVLINTSLRPYSRFWERLRPGTYPSLLRLLAGGVDARSREAGVLRFTSHLARQRPEQYEALLDQWTRWQIEQPVSSRNALRQITAAARFVAPRQAPSVPTLVLVGAGDRLVNPRCSHRLAQAWQSPISEHPQAGHDLPLDDGDWVIDQLKRSPENNR